MLFSGGRAALAHIGDSRSATSSPMPACREVLEWHVDGKPGRSADIGLRDLRDLRAGDRYLLRSDRLSPIIDDRPHRNVQTLRATSAEASASWPP
jgi:hypothetical protein